MPSNLLRPGHTKQTQGQGDGFTGDGIVTGSDSLSLSEVAPTLKRERRFTTEDVVNVTDFYVKNAVVKSGHDVVALLDGTINLQKRGAIAAGTTPTKGASTLVLTTTFGSGGFGQLGLGGSLTQNV